MPPKYPLKTNETLAAWTDAPCTSAFPPFRWLHSLLRIVIITFKEASVNRLSLRSGALTYTILLSMVPMLAMSTAVIKGLGGGNQLREVVYSYLDTLEQTSGFDEPQVQLLPEGNTADQDDKAEKEPGSDLTNHLRSAVDQLFDYVDRTNFATLGTFGMLGIFFTVILVLNNVETAMNAIWKVKAGRSILRKVTDYLTLMVLVPIAINVALAAGAVLKSQALAFHLDKLIPADWLQSLLLNGVPILFLTFALYAVYLFFPNTKLNMIPTFIGALLAGIFWFITQNVYISMQIGVAKYNAIYGSFATLPLFLVWIYFGRLFVLLGAQVAFAIQNNKRYRLTDQRDTPAIHLSAAFDICSAVSENFCKHKSTTLEQISEQFPQYRFELLETVRDQLVSADLMHHSEEKGTLMPSKPPESLDPHQLINAVIGSSHQDSNGGKASAAAVAAATASLPPIKREEELSVSQPGK